jgi:transposase
MDDTTVKLLQKGKGKNKARTAWFWVYARDESAWSGVAPPAVWYQFSTSRGAEHPPEHLEAYECFAQADAYAGYNDAYRTGRVRLSGNTWPMSGVFFDLYQRAKLPVAREAVPRIRQL